MIAALAVEIQENSYVIDEESEKINISQKVSTQISYQTFYNNSLSNNSY